jgi:hypothetical protein
MGTKSLPSRTKKKRCRKARFFKTLDARQHSVLQEVVNK